jgi:predicted nucleic acid-binding protein
VIYLDAAALVKLLHPEPETARLTAWLNQQAEAPRVSSVLIEVEVARAVRRRAPHLVGRVASVLLGVNRFAISPTVRNAAASFADPALRSLDAIHLATALELRTELDAFVTYDKRLLAAAEAAGLPVASPGA